MKKTMLPLLLALYLALLLTACGEKPANVTSPLPGTVLRLCKNTGDSVAAGEVVMIVESMKMENEVVAPEAGRIASIAVAAGSAINTGDLLFTLG